MTKEEKKQMQNILIDLIKEKSFLAKDLVFVENALLNKETNVVKNILCLNIDELHKIKDDLEKKQQENCLKIKEVKLKLILNWLEAKRLKSQLLSEVLSTSFTKIARQSEYVISSNLENLVVLSEANLAIKFSRYLFMSNSAKNTTNKITDLNKHMWRVLYSESDLAGWKFFLLEETSTDEKIFLQVKRV